MGTTNAHIIDAFRSTGQWPYRTAILSGPPRSGKSLLARWFEQSGLGEAIDDAQAVDEAALFHRWNSAQERKVPLLLVTGNADWSVTLPDLRSRLAAALHLETGPPDDAMLADLIAVHAEMRGFALDENAAAYLVPRSERSHMAIERLIAAIDRLSLERKQPPTLAIWRDALAELNGPA